MASSFGRFVSADWAANATAVPYANYGNPQSLNLYTYVRNNPTTTTDPDGHAGDCGVCQEIVDATQEEVDKIAGPLIESASKEAGPILGGTAKVAAGVVAGVAVELATAPAAGAHEQEMLNKARAQAPKKGSKGGPSAGKRATPKQRERALKENGGKCVFCGKPNEHVDHAHPRSRGGNTTRANLQGTCASCNLKKGAKTTQEFMKGKQKQD